VVIEVASFLRQHHISEQSELFSLRAPDATFFFAEQFSRKDQAIMRIWRAEQNDAQCRVNEHWREVQRKQIEAARLRSEIANLEEQLTSAEEELNNEEAQYYDEWGRNRYSNHHRLEECRDLVNWLKGRIHDGKSKLKGTLWAPKSVCQPLPRGESKALIWLFFLYMPKTYRVLSTLSFSGQQMLVPRPWNAECEGPDGTKSINVISPLLVATGECLTSFYDCHQTSTGQRRQGVRGDVALVSAVPISNVRPKSIGPTSIDLMSSEEDGVWYPDCLPYKMEWMGGTLSWDRCNGHAFDPFRVPRKWAVSYFTEKLDADGKTLQWAMRLDENSDAVYERGNRALACQESRPRWLTKTEFLTFCNMRAFPNKQLRNIVIAILDRLLPLQHVNQKQKFKDTD
jgi:hypothetical protein